MDIILASASERRKELLQRLKVDFKVVVSNYDEESVSFNGDCAEYVQTLAEGKVRDVFQKLADKTESIIIGCDTIVSINQRILGKPKDEKEAYEMLKLLSGKEHHVYSGLALLDTKNRVFKSDFVCTNVKFCNLSEEMLKWYIGTGESMDKAGAYGIQGYAGAFVEEINGCYHNVVGLPLNKLSLMLRDMGVNLYKGVS